MSNERFVRWQERTINQLTNAISLYLGLSVGGLGFLVALAKDNEISSENLLSLLAAIISFLISSVLGGGSVITRLIDFRLTMRKLNISNEYSKEFLCSNSEQYGKSTWRLFWSMLLFFYSGCLFTVLYIFEEYFRNLV